MSGCFSTGVNWVAECMDHFDICDTGSDGCGAPTPNVNRCVIDSGCDYASAGRLDDPYY